MFFTVSPALLPHCVPLSNVTKRNHHILPYSEKRLASWRRSLEHERFPQTLPSACDVNRDAFTSAQRVT